MSSRPNRKRIPDPAAAAPAVGAAIQRMAAVRLGRAFVPLALLLLVGVGRMLTGGGGLVLALGAPLAAGAMLAYGLRVVQTAFGRPRRGWMTAALAAGVIPPTYGIWVLGWLGLRTLADGGGATALLSGGLMALLGGWVVVGWLRILELARLAEVMALGGGAEAER